jgi:hypothetical protein
VRAEDAVPIMQKAQKMAAAMAYKAPIKSWSQSLRIIFK